LPEPEEARALLDTRGLCRRLGLPLRCGEWRPGDIIWWPETESGFVVAYANPREEVLLLLDRQTGYWRLRRVAGAGQEQRIQRAAGLTVTTLVALRLGLEPDTAARRLVGWFPRWRAA
jgi:hypothetical protein